MIVTYFSYKIHLCFTLGHILNDIIYLLFQPAGGRNDNLSLPSLILIDRKGKQRIILTSLKVSTDYKGYSRGMTSRIQRQFVKVIA